MIVVFDSDILIDFFKLKEEAVAKFTELKEKNNNISTTVFNYQETMKGFIKIANQEKIFFAENFFSSINVLNYSLNEARIAAEISSELEKTGNKIGELDQMIAAICLANHAILVTRNIKHFKKIKKLKIEKW